MAQESNTPEDMRGTLALNVGYSDAFGRYQSTSLFNEGSGYAQGGLEIDLSFRYRATRLVGIHTEITMVSHRFNEEGLAHAIGVQNQSRATVEGENHRLIGLFVGPFVRVNPDQALAFSFWGGLGRLRYTFPKIVTQMEEGNKFGSGTRSEAFSGNGFFVRGGANLRFQTPARISLNLHAGITSGVVPLVYARYDLDTDERIEEIRRDQRIRFFTISFGISYPLK